jgi:hypothetical protein
MLCGRPKGKVKETDGDFCEIDLVAADVHPWITAESDK